MTLKELRIQKGLSQNECAEYLGMTTRNYQNYENDSRKTNTARYNAIYQKIENYSVGNIKSAVSTSTSASFNTNVVTGEPLRSFYNTVAKFRKRDCFEQLKRFVTGDYSGKICILYGLRRTGKTTLLFQMLGELPISEVAYIKTQVTDTMSDLSKDLTTLYNMGCKYVFIDEITLLDDFIDTAAVLSDVFSMMGMKIVVSGTDSLGFAMANRDELYDRSIMIHTSFISFKEYARLLGIHSVDKYIEYGGTLKMENMSFDDPDYMLDDVSFRDDESTRKYIDTAISRNIQHTLKNDNGGEYFNELRLLYEHGELTNIINRIVENMGHRFLLSVIEDRFKSHDLGSSKNLILHDAPNERAYVLSAVDTQTIIERLKHIIDVKEKEETKVKVTSEHIEKVKKYLVLLDLIVNCPIRYESGKTEAYYVFSQPGMRYSIAKALVYSLMQDEYFKSVSEKDKDYIITKILEDVKGRMLEDIVLLEVTKVLPKNKEAFKFKFDIGGEFDMVIFDKSNYTCKIYEIKHSDKAVKEQARYLLDEGKCKIVEHKYGKITQKSVLYRGDDMTIDGVEYKNVERFLMEL